MNQSKSPPPSPMSSSSSTGLGYSFFFGAYFFGYYFFFSWAAGFEAPLAGADPAPILERPLAISLFTSLPFKVSTSLFSSSSDTVTFEAPRTVFKSAPAALIEKFTDVFFAWKGKESVSSQILHGD